MKSFISKTLFITLFILSTTTLKAADSLRFDMVIIFKSTTPWREILVFKQEFRAVQLDSTLPSGAKLWRCAIPTPSGGTTITLPGGIPALITSTTTPSEAVGTVCPTTKTEGVGLNGLYVIPEDIRAAGNNNDTLRGITGANQPLLGSCTDAGVATMHQCSPGSNVVKIAIIDSGVDCARATTSTREIEVFHTELQPYVCRDSKDSLDGIDNDNNGYKDDLIGFDFVENDGIPQDGTGHGTFVSGVISRILAANTAQTIKFLPLRVLDSTNSGTEFNIIRAVDYAVKRKVQIINASFVGADRLNNLDDKPLAFAFKVAGDSGIIVSAAAGNRTKNLDDSLYSPPSYINENLIVTGGTDCLSNIAAFSNFGASSVDIFAPAIALYSTWKRTAGVCTTNCYARYSGTSFAAPQTTAVAALLMSKLAPSNRRGNQAKCALLTSATYRPFLLRKGRRAATLNGSGACSIVNSVSLPCDERVGNDELFSGSVANFEVSPNPFSDVVNVRIALLEATDLDVDILDLTGKKIASTHFKGAIGDNQYPLSIKAVSGIYFIQIQAKNIILTRKIVKF